MELGDRPSNREILRTDHKYEIDYNTCLSDIVSAFRRGCLQHSNIR